MAPGAAQEQRTRGSADDAVVECHDAFDRGGAQQHLPGAAEAPVGVQAAPAGDSGAVQAADVRAVEVEGVRDLGVPQIEGAGGNEAARVDRARHVQAGGEQGPGARVGDGELFDDEVAVYARVGQFDNGRGGVLRQPARHSGAVSGRGRAGQRTGYGRSAAERGPGQPQVAADGDPVRVQGRRFRPRQVQCADGEFGEAEWLVEDAVDQFERGVDAAAGQVQPAAYAQPLESERAAGAASCPVISSRSRAASTVSPGTGRHLGRLLPLRRAIVASPSRPPRRRYHARANTRAVLAVILN